MTVAPQLAMHQDFARGFVTVAAQFAMRQELRAQAYDGRAATNDVSGIARMR